MNKVPRSEWRVIPNYFKVKLVSDFMDKWEALVESGEYEADEVFTDRVTSTEYIWVYQFPDLYDYVSDEDADYFEREDDNWVLSRDMFEVVGDENEEV